MDERRQRHHSPGDAQGRSDWTHARLSAVGKSSGLAQDDCAALSGRGGQRHSQHHGQRCARTFAWCAENSGEKAGPVDGVAADPIYLDVSVPPGQRKSLPVETTRHAFAYVFAGSGESVPCNASEPLAVPTESVGCKANTTPPSTADNRSLLLFDRGDEVVVQAGDEGVRFLLVSGKPLEEPVAWYGPPIVMNTQAQLQKAYQELQEGTFLKK